jgi:hypothetical protein
VANILAVGRKIPHLVDINNPQDETGRQLCKFQRRLTALTGEGDRAERQNLVAQIVRLLYNFEARPGQIDCVLWMLDKRFDSRDKNVFQKELDHAATSVSRTTFNHLDHSAVALAGI